MPRSRSKKKKTKIPSLDLKNDSNSQQSIDTLIENAETALDSFNYDDAECQLKEVLQIDPNNAKSIEMLSGVFIETFKLKEAQDLLKRCIELEPEIGYTKYFSMGQLCGSLESVRYYEKGIQILEKELENGENVAPSKSSAKNSTVRNLSEAYCSIAETFMTDCCDEDDAEQRCSTAIDLAIKSDPSNPEAYRVLADFQLIKGELEEAKKSAEKSLSLWLPQFEALREGENELVADKENVIPTYDSRIETSKLLIELNMYYEASSILESLLEEDDEVLQVWYLLGWLNYMREEEEYKGNAHHYLKMAKEVSVKLGVEDECVQHIDELLEELNQTHPISDVEIENEDEQNMDSNVSADSESDDMETN